MIYRHAFNPVNLGSLRLKNRIAMAQVTMNYATTDGFVTDRLIRYYAERARGGVGLIFVEGTYFTPEGQGYVRQLGIGTENHVEGLRKLTRAVHDAGSDVRIFLQIHHAGGRASSKVTGIQPVAPSAIPSYEGAERPRALELDEVRALVRAHIDAARRAREAGFDGVDIHCAHGYLVPAFFSPRLNHRTDEYGGSLENRTRFLREVIGGIRQELGRSFPVTIKISGDEYIEDGLRIRDMVVIAHMAQDAGIDGIIVSAGTPGGQKLDDLAEPHKVMRTLPMMTDPGCLVPIAAEFKKSLQIPVITVGRITTVALADEIVSSGKADIVAMGRALLADPELPKKAMEGREVDIRPCIGCNEGCYKRIFQQADICCSVNPSLGREGNGPVSGANPPKRVVVVGAGPAGMEAAVCAAERGHEVLLLERKKSFGGQLALAAAPPGRNDIARFRMYLENKLIRSGVKVMMNLDAAPDYIQRLKPDVVILATGAYPKCLNLPGLSDGKVATAWDVLSGNTLAPGPYLVVGGGLVGCETADFLSDAGETVALIEILPEIAADADKDTKAYFEIRFRDKAVAVYTGVKLLQVKDGTAVILQGNREVRIEVGTVVSAVGAAAEDSLYEPLVGMGLAVVKAGDCAKPRRILDAVHEGFLAASSI